MIQSQKTSEKKVKLLKAPRELFRLHWRVNKAGFWLIFTESEEINTPAEENQNNHPV